jgi:hypothetical protein
MPKTLVSFPFFLPDFSGSRDRGWRVRGRGQDGQAALVECSVVQNVSESTRLRGIKSGCELSGSPMGVLEDLACGLVCAWSHRGRPLRRPTGSRRRLRRCRDHDDEVWLFSRSPLGGPVNFIQTIERSGGVVPEFPMGEVINPTCVTFNRERHAYLAVQVRSTPDGHSHVAARHQIRSTQVRNQSSPSTVAREVVPMTRFLLDKSRNPSIGLGFEKFWVAVEHFDPDLMVLGKSFRGFMVLIYPPLLPSAYQVLGSLEFGLSQNPCPSQGLVSTDPFTVHHGITHLNPDKPSRVTLL